MKRFYIAYMEEIDGKEAAGVLTVSEEDNIANLSAKFGKLCFANLCKTKKEAEELAGFWAICSKRNGKYLYA